MIFTLVIIFLSIAAFTIIVLYFLVSYVFPRKLDEIAAMIEKGQTKLAARKLTDILQKDERNSYAHFLLAEAYMKDGNTQYAVVEYRQVLKMGGFDDKVNEVEIRRKLAKIYSPNGNRGRRAGGGDGRNVLNLDVQLRRRTDVDALCLRGGRCADRRPVG